MSHILYPTSRIYRRLYKWTLIILGLIYQIIKILKLLKDLLS